MYEQKYVCTCSHRITLGECHSLGTIYLVYLFVCFWGGCCWVLFVCFLKKKPRFLWPGAHWVGEAGWRFSDLPVSSSPALGLHCIPPCRPCPSKWLTGTELTSSNTLLTRCLSSSCFQLYPLWFCPSSSSTPKGCWLLTRSLQSLRTGASWWPGSPPGKPPLLFKST